MASRPRSQKKRGWPDGLYERNGYFTWRNPLTRKEMGIGRVPLGQAKAEAMAANLHVQGATPRSSLVDRLEGRGDTSWGAWLDEYERRMGLVASDEHDPPPLTPNTRKAYRAQVKRIRELWAEHMQTAVDGISTRTIAEGLKAFKAAHPRMAQTVRSRLLHSFDGAIAEGWTKTNPVTVTDEIAAPVKRARLTWEVFQTLYAVLPPGRLKNAVALALVSGQARETVCAAEFSQVQMQPVPGRQPVECWCVTRGKTGAQIAIPLDLRLEVFGMSLRDVIRQCRSSKIASRYMVHNTKRAKGARLGTPYPLNTLTEDFTAAVEALGLEWGDKTPPTFHELRSLSKRLYTAQGNVDTIQLLGHADEKTGQLYEDGRGSEYRLVTLAN